VFEDVVRTVVQRIVERFRPLRIILFGSRPVCKDVVVTMSEEIASCGQVTGSVLRAALAEGKVVYERSWDRGGVADFEATAET